MNLHSVMTELGTALTGIGLRVHVPGQNVSVPAAIVALPDEITYDATYGRGSDRMVIPVVVLAGLVSDRTAVKALAAYADGSGAKSVKAALDGGTYTACDSVTVAQATFDTYSIAGTEYLAALFDVDITGSGSS